MQMRKEVCVLKASVSLSLLLLFLLTGSAQAKENTLLQQVEYQEFVEEHTTFDDSQLQVQPLGTSDHEVTANFTPTISDPGDQVVYQSYSRIQGTYDTGDAEKLCRAKNSAYTGVTWKITSDTLAAGMPVDVKYDYTIEGYLKTGKSGLSNTALISSSLVVYHAESTLTTEYVMAALTPTGALAVEPDSDWTASDFTDESDANYWKYSVNWTVGETLPGLTVGDEITLNYSMNVGCESQNPEDMFAESNFYDTSSYALSSTNPNVGFEIVPEPSALALLTAGCLLLLWRRRKVI